MPDDAVFLELFHGRDDAYADMEDWGDEGPILGPLDYVHITYGSIVHISFNGDDYDLVFANDCLGYAGIFYGDFSVISATRAAHPELAYRRELPDVSRTKLAEQRR